MLTSFVLLACAASSSAPTIPTAAVTQAARFEASRVTDLAQQPNPWLVAYFAANKIMLAAGIRPQDLANNIDHLLRTGNVWPMWVCEYADGTVVHNKFRYYRDAEAVTRYFFGEPDRHDRDAFYDLGGRRYRWDTRWARQFAMQHGGVVSIRCIE